MLEADYRIDRDSIRLIPNGWTGTPLPRPSSFSISVVCIAKLRAEKDHQSLIRAIAKMKKSGVVADLTIVGDGPESVALNALAVELGVDNQIRFIGYSNDIWSYLSKSKIFILPSRIEPFGIVVLEAMAAGVPIIATRADGPSSLIEDGSNGILIPIGDIDAMAKAIISLLGDQDLCLRLSEAGLKTAELFRSDHMISRYENLYRI
jgi:glycosyltransferase involved in cell wall biosynthesis